MLHVLIDHDNLPPAVSAKGSHYIVDRILETLPDTLLRTVTHVQCRFYGGWFSGSHLTRRAQQLSADIGRDFPAPMTALKVSVTAELARSLLVDPMNDLWHTFRARQGAPTIGCKHPVSQGCRDPSCPLVVMTQALTVNRCPTTNCSVRPRELLERNEQKLVDSMMAVDSLFVRQTLQHPIAIVSSDDDLWPPIHMLLATGRDLHLIHTKPRTTPYGSMIRPGWGALWQGTL